MNAAHLRTTITWQVVEPQAWMWSRDGSLVMIMPFMGKCCYEQRCKSEKL